MTRLELGSCLWKTVQPVTIDGHRMWVLTWWFKKEHLKRKLVKKKNKKSNASSKILVTSDILLYTLKNVSNYFKIIINYVKTVLEEALRNKYQITKYFEV